MPTPTEPHPTLQGWAVDSDFLASEGTMAPMIRALDWDNTGLGQIGTWPDTLKAILGVGLNSRFPVCIYWGPDYHLLYNDPWSAIPGDKHPWALGRPAREAWADIWPILQPMFDGIMHTGVAVHTVDGLLPMQRFGYVEECYFNYNVSPIFGYDGKPLGLFNTVIETTEKVLDSRRSKLLGELRDSLQLARDIDEVRSRCAALLEAANIDLPFCLLYLNEAGQAGTQRLHTRSGLSADSPLAPLYIDGQVHSHIWAPSTVGQQHLFVEQQLEPWPEPVTSAYVLPLQAEDHGVLGTLVCGISPRRQLDDNYREFLHSLASTLAIGIAQVMRQVEEQRQARDMQQRIELRTRERDRLWALSHDLLCVSAKDGTLVSINPAWSTTLGWNESELLGRTTHWLEHPDDTQETDAKREFLAQGNRLLRFENRLRHSDGSYRWLSWSATPDGDLLYGGARDITEEKRTAEVLARTEEALRNAQRMEAVGQLTGGIAHDFNNLLAGIQVSLDLIERRLPSTVRDDLQRFIQAAAESARRGAALTHNLLSFSRRQALDMRPLQLNTLIRDLQPQLAEQAGERTELQLDLTSDCTHILSDADQLRKALLHLVDNARDALPDGGQLQISTHAMRFDGSSTDLAPGDYLLLQVKDSGTGMSEDILERAFEPFFTTKAPGQGSGLGLSMVYGFIKQIGGQIRLHSATGHGTTVNLYFPRSQAEEDNVQGDSDAPAVPASRPCVLVVEDSDVVRMLTIEVLEEFGYQVLEAGDAEEALPILQSAQTIDLLMTDVGLPGMNGQELALAARKLRPDLLVLFATGYAEIVSIDGSDLATQMDVIGKPFSLESLRDKVAGMLQGRGKAR
ncbi:response regulator [Pseudomonas sp. PDM14]|uniref:ATP-binding protein n=1 Tax=Pseudomonas sp. PDM14 TaxID=2769288 RepID=UPI00177E0EC9|nr:ATP-binding protein [Pseudomonas sp. PDM14]MBD9483603.1 response regulator [Pseudomonas sp. PDM14]